MIHSHLRRNRLRFFYDFLERIIKTNIINRIAEIKVSEPTVPNRISGVVGFKASVKSQNKKVKVITQSDTSPNRNVI